MKRKDKSNQQLTVSSQRPSASERELVQALLTVNNVGLADRCRRYRRRRMAAMTTVALCLLAIVPVTAASAIPTHDDYVCAISPSGHTTAFAAVTSINKMFCRK
ncbi:MAG: hypothetical protein J5711_02950 [Bacteroidales bacterium]|nr:hypothetical protein [Bacteroidales bacterium]